MNFSDPGSLGWWFYPVTFVLNLFDSFFPPLPQELFVAGIGPLAEAGSVAVVPALLVSWVANVLGDVLLWWVISRWRGALERWRWGQWLLCKSQQGLDALGDRGSFGVLTGLRFVSGGRTASYAAAGLAGISPKVIWGSTAVGSAGWVLFMVVLGQLTHNATGLPAWASAVIGMGVGTLIGAVPALIAWVRRRGKGSSDTHEESGAPGAAGTARRGR